MCPSSIYCSVIAHWVIGVWRRLIRVSFNIDIPENNTRAISRNLLLLYLTVTVFG